MSHYDPYEKLRKLEIAYRRGEVPERVYRVLKAKYLREIKEIERYERSLLGEEWEEERKNTFKERKVEVTFDVEDILNKYTKQASSRDFLLFYLGVVFMSLSAILPIFAIIPILIGVYIIKKGRVSYHVILGMIMIISSIIIALLMGWIYASASFQTHEAIHFNELTRVLFDGFNDLAPFRNLQKLLRLSGIIYEKIG
ncbi:MAG: hypothetical protein J7L91_05670 [Candidatus Korarchaeota archaeon]|nr:hypothetical protein [Candidatus Korarchaeota archaeon]